ncbi:DUF3011 domain-containing protein [Sphingopyxis sp.]|uniref:DUF3011 domain-containing protein n=1 Tax=Sphingopyxis sp. TaxID=1908224 RepID=UPI0035B0DCED
MRNPVVTAVTAASFVVGQFAVPAFAQTTYPYPPPGSSYPGYDQGWAGTIRCESYGNRQQRCKVRTENRVELIRVIGGRCSKGRDWGFDTNEIWVSGGCRAEFRYGYSGGGTYPGGDYAGTLRCESRNNRYEQCNVQTNGRVELLRKLGGKCNSGRQWGFDSGYIWVTNGCRAEFGYGYANLTPLPGPKPDKDKGPSTGLIIGGIVVAGGLLALLASQKKKKDDGSAQENTTPPPASSGPAVLSANLSGLPSAARPSVQNCMNDAARQIGATGGTKLSYDKLVSLEQGNGGWRIRAAMTATYPDGAKSLEMYCRATPSDIIQLDFS